jgi:hypothetical protein
METPTAEKTNVLFEEHVRLTGVTEYGLSWNEMNEGKADLPQEGARFDISFKGELKGSRIKGTVKGVDYLTIRADGRFILRIYATVITHDGEYIALEEDGILIPHVENAKHADLQFNMKFTTASPRYDWLNNLPVWGIGYIDRETGSVYIKGYTL